MVIKSHQNNLDEAAKSNKNNMFMKILQPVFNKQKTLKRTESLPVSNSQEKNKNQIMCHSYQLFDSSIALNHDAPYPNHFKNSSIRNLFEPQLQYENQGQFSSNSQLAVIGEYEAQFIGNQKSHKTPNLLENQFNYLSHSQTPNEFAGLDQHLTSNAPYPVNYKNSTVRNLFDPHLQYENQSQFNLNTQTALVNENETQFKPHQQMISLENPFYINDYQSCFNYNFEKQSTQNTALHVYLNQSQ